MCPIYDLSKYINLIAKIIWIVGVAAIAGGILFTFFGRYLFIATMFIFGLVVGVIGTILLTYGTFLKDN